ncbi:hypothetical protein DM02DRAFT_91530 [Periconia macrospinosa]|uniref:Uncharacterized protein n=1 Tax=Periconia macrospinosa TaxID=97972 RepID=A0A2V1DG89_9PLEO|nr:hypothetical protein DM02DRAFT_91530 [Periconia macrospinosa]
MNPSDIRQFADSSFEFYFYDSNDVFFFLYLCYGVGEGCWCCLKLPMYNIFCFYFSLKQSLLCIRNAFIESPQDVLDRMTQ